MIGSWAENLIMPSGWVVDLYDNPDILNVSVMADYFGVSVRAMCRRIEELENVGILGVPIEERIRNLKKLEKMGVVC